MQIIIFFKHLRLHILVYLFLKKTLVLTTFIFKYVFNGFS